MTYLLRRTDQGGGYVAKPGSAKSYTTSIRLARKYPDREAAVADSCPGNEIPVPLEDVTD